MTSELRHYLHKSMRFKYEQPTPDAPKDFWKEMSDEIINKNVIEVMYTNLKDAKIIPPTSSNFYFLSPSSNIATHERWLFDLDAATRTGKGTFIAGDLVKLQYPREARNLSLGNSTFRYRRMDAHAIAIADGKVDLLWDRKGWLWYVLFNLVNRGPEDVQLAIAAFQEYARLLKPEAYLVVDGRDVQGERSTKTLLHERMQKNPDIAQYVEHTFTPREVGTDLATVLTLQKKSA
jgi:hypothetical protein